MTVREKTTSPDRAPRPTGVVGRWGDRCLRSVLVGGPPVLALKYFLNGSRPEDDHTSRWRPFDSPSANGAVSGHAFISATAFLNAAMMTDNRAWKFAFYGASTMTAWSRINDRMHYFSQALMGWWLAWLAADAVNGTELCHRNFIVVPQVIDDGMAVQVYCSW